MSREALLGLLQARLGLDPSSLGPRVVDDAFADARRELGVADDEALLQRVLLDPDSFAKCAEWFMVRETWFFRSGEQYADLARFARDNPGRRPLRVLSLPSSTGEEAYSAAMTLLDAGLALADIDVLGIDVSRSAVLHAQAGAYRSNALRGQPAPAWLLEGQDGMLVVDRRLSSCVRFRVGNALDPSLLRQDDLFDVAFCRNLIIYLLPDARRRLLQTIMAVTQPGALLLAGQAEILSSLSDAVGPYEGGCPLSFVKGGARTRTPTVARSPAPTSSPARAARSPAAATPSRPPMPVQQPSTASPPAAPVVDPMVAARQLADAGQIALARSACLDHLAGHPDDAGALYLLGLLESAAGNADAADRAFTQVSYLDRSHLDAIEQRVGLAERRGEANQARELRARAARLRRQRETAP